MLHKWIYRTLTIYEISDQEGTNGHEQFVARVHERLGSWILPTDLGGMRPGDTPLYDSYEDEKQNKQTFSSLQVKL